MKKVREYLKRSLSIEGDTRKYSKSFEYLFALSYFIYTALLSSETIQYIKNKIRWQHK